jgi:site-specific DNA-methyltransferase (adenine-specific)
MRAFQEFSRQWAVEALRLLKPGGHLVSFASPRTYHRMVCGIEDAGFEIRDGLQWLFGSGMPKSRDIAKALAKKKHAQAEQWDGWGTGLKPAYEPIALARKPFRGPLECNVVTHGTGALNIEACRIETDENLNGGAYSANGRGSVSPSLHQLGGMNKIGATAGEYVQPVGRWPANVLHDGSEEVVAMFPAAPGQKGEIKYDEGARTSGNVYNNTMKRGHEPSAQRRYADQGVTDFAALPGMRRFDKGSAARFFYSPKTSSADRHEGLEHPGPQFRQHSTLRDAEKLMKAQTRKGNHHPTVKPTALMRWLVRLVTPPGGRTLDPFVGSGSTGKAAVLEGFDFDGIEVDNEHVAISQRRIGFARLQGHQPELL